MPLGQAVHHDLSQERRIGLVYPSYWFNAPRAMTELLPRLQLPKETEETRKRYLHTITHDDGQTAAQIYSEWVPHTVQMVALDLASRV